MRAARRLRREMTEPEVRLWARLRRAADGAPRWRRQHPLGPYALDVYCPAARLCVEMDGWAHNMGDQPARDARRDAWLLAQGVVTLRITAVDVLADADEAAYQVGRLASERVERGGDARRPDPA